MLNSVTEHAGKRRTPISKPIYTKEERLEKRREAVRRYQEKNRDKVRAMNRDWKMRNKDKVKLYDQKRRKENPERARAESAKSYHKHRERRLADSREWQKNNPERKRAIEKKYRENNPEKIKETSRRSHLKRKYGITLEQYNEMLARQDYCCAACKTDDPGTKHGWHLDHNHTTGEVRGILCHACNTTIGFHKEDKKRLLALIDYLARFG